MVTFFAGTIPAYKVAAKGFGPATSNLIRFTIAAAALSFIARRRLRVVPPKEFRRLLVIGMFGIGLMAIFLGIGVDRGSATVGSIVIGLEPIGVALAGILIVGDRPTKGNIVALVMGIAGAVIASGILSQGTDNATLIPVLVLLGTVVTFSMYTALVHGAAQGIDPLAVAAITQIGGLAFVIPACLFDIVNGGMIRSHPLRTDAIVATLFLGIGSALGYYLLCSVLANLSSSRVAVSMFLIPLLGVMFSWAIVGENLYVRHAVGAAIVLAAVWISERSSRNVRHGAS